ncbi:MAG TPA: (2Fe-2S)-binding protein [Planctomycetota bacterium]|nr:(2Fe-2S)-binding protein [Planctomycetota bacterium]
MSVPKIVLEHYRSPRNKRAIPGGHAGTVEGREDGKALTVFVRVEGGTIVDASFTNTGDRMDDPGASALTEILRGLTLDEASRLTVVDVASRLESGANPGIAIVAHEALRLALHAARGVAPPPRGRLICHCFHVHEDRIRRYVRERGLKSVDEVRSWTRANSGCRSCRPDIEAIIAQELSRPR